MQIDLSGWSDINAWFISVINHVFDYSYFKKGKFNLSDDRVGIIISTFSKPSNINKNNCNYNYNYHQQTLDKKNGSIFFLILKIWVWA